MPTRGKLGTPHERFAALLHEIDPKVLIRMACAAAGIDVGELHEVCYRNPRLEVPSVAKQAMGAVVDLVYTVHTRDDRITDVWLFEPQVSWRSRPSTQAFVPEQVVEQGNAERRDGGELDENGWVVFAECEREGHSFQLGRERGIAEGREQAKLELLRRSIADMLELLGFELNAAQLQRIRSCASIESLERWYAAVETAAANQPVEQLLS